MKRSVVFLIILCIGCSSKPKTQSVHISLIDSNRSIKFKGLDYAIISEINRDSTPGIWQNLIPVYRMPADTDMKDYQSAQPGLYQLKDSAVIFTPYTPFSKGQTYFIRYFQFDEGDNKWDYIRGKKKLGEIPHIDLIFKK